MSLFRHVPTQLIEDMNLKNDAIATVNDIAFDQVRETTPDELALKGKDTRARTRGISAKYYGTGEIFYNRIKLQTAFANQLVKVTFLRPFNSLHSQLQQLNSEFSSVFTTDDFEDFVPADPEAATGIMTLTAKADSLGWSGTVDMAYETITPTIIAIPDAQLDGIITPNERKDVTQAALLYTSFDFKADTVWIEGTPIAALAPVDLDRLRSALMVVRPNIDWVIAGVAPYSLEGAVLRYVGTSPDYIINTAYKQVCVIDLGDKSTEIEGTLYLHYSKEGDV